MEERQAIIPVVDEEEGSSKVDALNTTAAAAISPNGLEEDDEEEKDVLARNAAQMDHVENGERTSSPDTLNSKEAEDFVAGKYKIPKVDEAVRNGNKGDFLHALDQAIVEARLTDLENLKEQNPSGTSLLHIAAYCGKDEIVKLIIENEKFNHFIFHRNSYGDTPLHCAAGSGQQSTVKVLLNHAKLIVADGDHHLLNEKNDFGHTALHGAVLYRNYHVLEFFISEYRVLFQNVIDDLLQLALQTCYKKIFWLLLNKFPANSSDGRRFEQLKAAYEAIMHSRTGNEERRDKLPDTLKTMHVITSEQQDKASCLSALFETAKNRNTREFTDTLDKLGARRSPQVLIEILSKRCPSENSLLHVAASNGNDKIVNFIASNFLAQLLHTNCTGDTALHVAARGGYLSTIQNLLLHAKEEGQYFGYRHDHLLLTTRSKNGHTALHEAVMNGHHNIVEFFAFHNEYRSVFENIGFHDLLELAIKVYDKASFEMLQVFPSFVSNSTQSQQFQLKAAYHVITKENEERRGKQPVTLNRIEATPLFEVAKRGNTKLFIGALHNLGGRKSRPELIEILGKEDSLGNSLLHVAASCGNDQIVQYIAANFFAQIFRRNFNRDTVLHIAARGGHLSTIQSLLHYAKEEGKYFGDDGYDYFLLKAKNKYGHTVLHEAVMNGCHGIVEFLASHSPYGFIFKYGFHELLQLAVIAYDRSCFEKILQVSPTSLSNTPQQIQSAHNNNNNYYYDYQRRGIERPEEAYHVIRENRTEFDRIKAAYLAIRRFGRMRRKPPSVRQNSTEASSLDQDDRASRLSALFEAAKNGNTGQFVDALHKCGGRERRMVLIGTRREDSSGNSLLHMAASCGNDEIVKYITSNCFAQIFCCNYNGDTTLHVAARGGHVSTIQILLQLGMEEEIYFDCYDDNGYSFVNAKNMNGYTVVHEAVKGGYHAIVKFFATHSEYGYIFKDIVKYGFHDLLVLAVKAYDKASFEKMFEVFPTLISNTSRSQFQQIQPAHNYGHKISDIQRSKKAYHIIMKDRRVFEKVQAAYYAITKEARSKLNSVGEATMEMVSSAPNWLSVLFEAAKTVKTGKLDDVLRKLERRESRAILTEIPSPSGDSLLHLAASNGNDQIVDFIASNFFAQFFHTNCSGDTPLHVAARGGHQSTFEKILKHAKEEGEYFGDNQNDYSLLKAKNGNGHTALHVAVMNGNNEIVGRYSYVKNKRYRELFEDIVENGYCELFVLAVKSYDRKSFKEMMSVLPKLLPNTPEFQQIKATGDTQSFKKAYHAIMKDNQEIQQIRDAYNAITKEVEEGRSKQVEALNRTKTISLNHELFQAARERDKDVRKLRTAFNKVKAEQGQSILEILSRRDPSGNSMLHVAASCGNDSVVGFIACNFFAQIFNRNWQGDTPLHVATRGGHISTVKSLLSYAKEEGEYFGYDGNAYSLLKKKNKHGQTALHEALLNGHIEIVKVFVGQYKGIFDDYTDGENYLQGAINSNNKELIEVLLSPLYERCSSNSNAVSHQVAMYEAAHAAIMNGKTDLFKEVSGKIPSQIVELTDKDGRYLLHWAAQTGNLMAVQRLLEESKKKKIEWSREDKEGKHPIHIACERGHTKIIKELDATLYYLTSEKQNILHLAAERGNNEVVSFILGTPKMKDHLNEKDVHGNTPLHLAAKNSNTAVVLTLTWAKGVKLDELNVEGLTPLDVFLQIHRNKASLRHSLTNSALKSAGCLERWELKEGKNKRYRSTKGTRSLKHQDVELKEIIVVDDHGGEPKGTKLIKFQDDEPKGNRLIKDQVGALSTVATLVATVTFTAGFTVPGGFNSSDGADKGLATMLHKHMFQVFAIFNTISFFLSILSIISCFYAIDEDNGIATKAFALAKRLFGIALVMMATAFLAAIYLGVSKLSWLAYLILIIGFLFLFILFFEFLRSLIPMLMEKRWVRYISYYMSRAMIFIFVKDHEE